MNGNLLSETKNDGSVIEYAYDNLGNMLKEGSRSFTYNNHNNKVSASYKNKTITYQYDKFNNIAEVKDANNNITKYKWDVYGNRTEVSTSKATIKYSYDDRNLMTSIKEGTKEVASYTYDNRGNVTSLTRDKLKSEYQYDELNRRIVFNNYKNNELKTTYTCAFDGNDNVIKEVINGKENTYTYDAMDELKTSSKYVDGKVVNTEYSYDFLGNKVEKTEDGDVRKYHYNKYNQLTNITTKEGITDIYYDKNGNMENILYVGDRKSVV